METRKVTLYTTLGKVIKIDTDAETWGDLRPLVNDQGINTNEMRAMENKTKTSLEHDEAALPEGSFTVFFTKINSKAGSEMSYKELRSKIKDLIDNKGAGNFFNVGKNYTNKSKDDLASLYAEYTSGIVSENKAASVEESYEAPAEGVKESCPEVSAREALEALSNFISAELDDEHFGIEDIDSIKDALDMEDMLDDSISLYLFGEGRLLPTSKETEEERAIREAERAEAEALAEEARGLGLM